MNNFSVNPRRLNGGQDGFLEIIIGLIIAVFAAIVAVVRWLLGGGKK